MSPFKVAATLCEHAANDVRARKNTHAKIGGEGTEGR